MKFSVSGESNSLNWWNRFQPVRVSSKQFEARTSLNYGPILNAFSVLSAIASSTSASSFIGEYATTTRYTQRSVEKTCSPQIPDLGQSNTCGEGTFDHESTCDTTCDATSVTIEQTWRRFPRTQETLSQNSKRNVYFVHYLKYRV